MRKKVIIGISIVIILLVLSTVLFFLKNDKPGVVYTSDEIKFKNEYETLNNKEIDDLTLVSINIDEDNNVHYVDFNKLIEKLENGTNVILLGSAFDNSSRIVIPTLVETLKKNNIENLYYYDLKSLYDGYINDYENNKEDYEKLVSIIGDRIDTVFDTDDEKSGVKEILMPTVIFVKEGNIIGLHSKSIDTHIDDTETLNEEETNELKKKYQELIDIMNADVCIENNEGC